MSLTYDWYFAALSNPSQVGRAPQLAVHENEPQPGFYRKRRGKNGPFDPVAIWPEDGSLVAMLGNEIADPHDLWTWVCRSPVTEEAYRRAARGDGWGDEPPAPAEIGHNSGASDPFDALTIEYAGEAEQANEFLATPIATQEQADRAAVWSKRLSEIAKKAADLHKVEKQPALDESRRIDERWRDLKDGPKELATKLKRHLDTFLQEQDRVERERQRVASEEAARIRREAEDAARAASASQNSDAEAQANADRLAREAQQVENDAKARNAAAGRTGAKVSLRTFVSAEIADYDALLMALKDRSEIREVVQSLANRAAKSGVGLPGMKIVEERRAA
ncbi:hypothetical protein [Aureimonas pseudogalii]|uniref:Uncharacterized protein n=1 Tax=Aureimonas pseudogalii TaxID=1744844 RepID=A0A7W6H3U1_9HYPH|nr:hypothetical protein [Aureimonas pseudogalii]MBB3997248.1 hypothetical protein [Aureimonas pseudogalii]